MVNSTFFVLIKKCILFRFSGIQLNSSCQYQVISKHALRRFGYPSYLSRMSDHNKLIKLLEDFRDERDWAQFHDSKNLALALSIEAAELNELFLWKRSADEINAVNKERLAEELADVFAYAYLLAARNGLDVSAIVKAKVQANGKKYPVSKAKGSATKYNEL